MSRLAEVTLVVVDSVTTPFWKSVCVREMVFSPDRVVPLTTQVAKLPLANKALQVAMKSPWLVVITGFRVILMDTLSDLAGGVEGPPPLFLLQERKPENKNAERARIEVFFIKEIFRCKFRGNGHFGQYRKSRLFFYWILGSYLFGIMFFLCPDFYYMKRSLCVLTLGMMIRVGISQQLLPMAEQRYTDSLNKVFQSAGADSAKALAGYLLSDYWRSRDTAKSRSYLSRGEQLAAGNAWLRALSPFYEGQYYFNSDHERAAAYFKEAQASVLPFSTPVAYQTMAAAWFNYALMCRNEKGDDFVINILLNKAIPLSTKAGDPQRLAHYYSQLGAMLMNNARFDKAELYNQKAIDLLKDKYPASTELLFAYLSAVSTYVYDSKNEQAKVCLDNARDMLAPFPESVNYPDFYYNEGLYYTGVNEFDKALASLDKGIPLAEQYHQDGMLQNLLFRKWNIYLEQKDYKKANQFLVGLVGKPGQMAEANNRRAVYGALAKTNELLGDMKSAYHWSTLYGQLSDSLHGSQLKEKIAALETKFRSSENEKQINRLQAEKTQIELSARNSRLYNWLLGVSCLFLLALAGFSWSFFRQQKKEQRLKVTRAMLEGEERERKRIAQDLHDGLGGMLAGVKLNLSGWAAGNKDQPQDLELNKIITQLDKSVGELRNIARNMMPESLLRLGLEPALRDLCEFYMGENVHVDFQPFAISYALPFQWQVNIYRIAQELLSNAVRHAQATNIILQFSQNESVFFITVEDNGVGLDQGQAAGKKGMGLANVGSRVEYMKGKMEIVSAKGEGTTVNIELRTNAEQ